MGDQQEDSKYPLLYTSSVCGAMDRLGTVADSTFLKIFLFCHCQFNFAKKCNKTAISTSMIRIYFHDQDQKKKKVNLVIFLIVDMLLLLYRLILS